MANQSSDRQRMSNDLRELARLAKPGSDSPVHGFDSADSSGYVDLSAYSTSDAGWVDRELARARKGAPPPPVGGRTSKGRAIDVLTPASMSPVSLELSGEPEDTMSLRPSRARGVLYTTMGLAAVAAVGVLAFTLAKHPPPASTPATTAAAALAPPPPADVPMPPPAVTAAATTTAAAVAAPPTPVAVASTTTTSKAKRKTVAVSRAAHAVAQAPAAAPVRAATPAAVVLPKSTPSAGGDSLLDLIKKSVATGK